jgi:hypothetical protein
MGKTKDGKGEGLLLAPEEAAGATPDGKKNERTKERSLSLPTRRPAYPARQLFFYFSLNNNKLIFGRQLISPLEVGRFPLSDTIVPRWIAYEPARPASAHPL